MAIGTGLALLGSAALGLGGSYLSSEAAKDAANTQANAGERALEQFAPYTGVGKGAITTLGQLFGIGSDGQQTNADFSRFFESPDYQFAFKEGQRAVNFGNSALGQVRSGNNMRDLTEYGQGMATQNFGNYVNRLMGLSQLGQSSAAQSAAQIGNIGQAQASGTVGSANALSQGLSGVGNNLALYSLLGGGGNSSAYGSQSASAFSNPTLYSGGLQSVMM
jgi:hypothetical protein